MKNALVATPMAEWMLPTAAKLFCDENVGSESVRRNCTVTLNRTPPQSGRHGDGGLVSEDHCQREVYI